jgi:hypothetical protein
MSVSKAITTVNALSIVDGNYLEARVETSASEGEDARIEAAANSAAGLLIQQMEAQKDPKFKPDTDSSTLAVMKMSEGAMDVSVVRSEFI